MLRKTRMEVHLGALQENYRNFQKLVGPSCHVIGVVKANGYGLGMIPVAKALEEAGCRYFAVAIPEEALLLRESGVDYPIMVLGPSPEEAASYYVAHSIAPAVVELWFGKVLAKEALRQKRRAHVHIKVDTGMGRVGVLVEELPDLLRTIQGVGGVKVEGLFSHFATADEPNREYSRFQIDCYQRALGIVESQSSVKPWRHLCNTAGTLNFPGAHFDGVRVGLGIYGMKPSPCCKFPFDLQKTFRVVTEIAQLRCLPPRWGVGYGLRYVTRGEDLMAVLPLGYHDGYGRSFSGKAQVLIRGVRAPVVGSVCMDQVMVDVSHIPGVSRGDEVVLVGEQGDQEISPEEMASWIGTINYEIPHLFSSRVPRIYL